MIKRMHDEIKTTTMLKTNITLFNVNFMLNRPH